MTRRSSPPCWHLVTCRAPLPPHPPQVSLVPQYRMSPLIIHTWHIASTPPTPLQESLVPQYRMSPLITHTWRIASITGEGCLEVEDEGAQAGGEGGEQADGQEAACRPSPLLSPEQVVHIQVKALRCAPCWWG